MNSDNQKSQHILNAASNLVGICFIVLTSLRLFSNKSEKTVIDEIASVALLLFMASCILSFLSLRSKTKKSARLEGAADLIFLSGLSLLFVTTMLFVFNVIR